MKQKWGEYLTWQKVAVAAGLVSIVTISAVSVILWQRLSQVVVRSTQNNQPVAVTPSPSLPPDPNRDRAVVLLGYGGGSHAGGVLTDTMILAVVQPKFKRVVLLSLPRDSWVALPLKPDGMVESKLNSAYSYGLDTHRYLDRPREFTGSAGGGQLAKYAVAEVTGVNPEYFVAIDFAGFVRVVDKLGGVTVKVAWPFVDEWYPVEGKETDTCEKSPEEIAAVATLSATLAEQAFPCRYERLEFLAGSQQMDGATALKYVRSRHSNQDGGDLGRAARQRLVLAAIKAKLFQLSSLPKLPSIVTALSSNITTDIPVTEWDDWLTRASELESYQLVSLVINDKDQLKPSKSQDGQYILVPRAGDWSAIHDWVTEQLKDPAATLSATPSLLY